MTLPQIKLKRIENMKDTQRRAAAAREILDGRDPVTDIGAVLVTLEGVVAAVLLLAMKKDPKKAATMLNEGLIDGVNRRLSHYAVKTKGN